MSHPSTSVKKRKTYHFHNEWEEEFFFTMVKEKCTCIICNSSVAIPKKSNVERHFRTIHKNYNQIFPLGTETRKTKVKHLKSQLSMQQSFITKFGTKSEVAKTTIASFKVAEVLIKHKKPFEDGEIWKEGFIKAGEILFENFKNKSEIMASINDISLLRNTVMRRTEAMCFNLEEILQVNINKCKFLSLQFDESTDFNDTAQICVFIRMVFQDMSATEELLTILPLKERISGEDIFKSFKSFINRAQFPVYKVVSITTDGSPAMVENEVGFVSLCKNDEAFPKFTSYHCIIHEQSLCSKVLNSQQVMDVTFKIISSIREDVLLRHKFRALLDECESKCGELLLHTDVRWLNRAKFLKIFRDLLPEIQKYLTVKGEMHPQIEDKNWVLKLAFLSDIAEKLNQFNWELRGKQNSLMDLISTVKTFKNKLSLLEAQLRRGDLKNFINMESECKDSKNIVYNQYADQVAMLLNELNGRFDDFSKLEDIVSFMSFPFNDCLDVEEIANKIGESLDVDPKSLEDEILKLNSDLFLKTRALSINNFWNLLCENKYPLTWVVAAYLTSFFGSTYLCESAFSSMNSIKINQRSRLTNDHLIACLRIAISTYEPQFEKIASNMQCEISDASFGEEEEYF